MFVDRRGFLCGLAVSACGMGAVQVSAEKSAERLEFRLVKAKTMHLHDEKMAKSYQASFKALGVPCKLHGHDDHFDLSVECPTWKRAEFASHAEVEKWQKWLDAIGFETKHSH